MADFEKPSSTEEEYFAREEIEKKRKLALQQAEQLAAHHREGLKQLHYMKCPKCGMDLHTMQRGHGKVEVDACFNCHGVWLDKGELEQIVGHEERAHDRGGVTRALVNIFRTK